MKLYEAVNDLFLFFVEADKNVTAALAALDATRNYCADAIRYAQPHQY